MRLPNETEELVVLFGGILLVLYLVGKGLFNGLSSLWTTTAGQPMVLADNIEVPGTGQTAGDLRKLGYTNADINTMWGSAAADPTLVPGFNDLPAFFIAP